MHPRQITETARAKINLTLHVTGRRADGYHLLDSLVVFAEAGDIVTVQDASDTSLTVTGPFAAHVPANRTNLVFRAAQLAFPGWPVALRLDKYLPPASGLGGGSADAAAAVRAMTRLSDLDRDSSGARKRSGSDISALLLALGADLPVCLASRAARMRGVGEVLADATAPACPILLVNPGIPLPTQSVFKALGPHDTAPMEDDLPTFRGAIDLAHWLTFQRNDLELPALGLAPVIATVLATLRSQPGTLIARMSGSGATCFALFERNDACTAAARAISCTYPTWWTMPTTIAGAM